MHREFGQRLFANSWRRGPVLALLLSATISISVFVRYAGAQSSAEPPGAAELKRGEYDAAIKLIGTRLTAKPDDADAAAQLLRAYIETGRYPEAEASAKKFLVKNPGAFAVRRELAEVFALTGRYPEAVTDFERAGADAKAPADKLLADLRRAEILELTGQDDRARPIFEALVTHYQDKKPETAAELTSVARALVHLERFQDANDVYREATEADPTYIDAWLGAGELFTEKYNYGEAAQFLESALQINPNSARALMAVARNKRLDGADEMLAALTRALVVNPKMADALIFKARLALEERDYPAATSALEQAFKVNPRSLDAQAVNAAMLYLQDRDLEPQVAATLAINPRYGEIFGVLSHYATITRRTADAAAFAKRATEISPRLWSAHLDLGMALLRLGQMSEGRAAIEKSFKGDPYNVWAKNTLDLLDVMADYRETKHGAFLIKADAKESDVVTPYAAELLDEAANKLTAKYRFTPHGPITVELFRNHEDFAVRALGLPGLGALGVCFGQVIAADSPSARATGEFNWGSTLWHEYTHVITLQMTDYRVPRWFSEGLSVYEERRARPGWGDKWNLRFLRTFAGGRWHKFADLDSRFQRPRSPEDLSIAYFQASEVCEFIVDRYGFDSILRMLALYREKAQTTDVLARVFKLSENDFDRAFKEYLEAKTRAMQNALVTEWNVAASLTKEEVIKLLATQDTFALHLRLGHLLRSEDDLEKAIPHLRRAIELFPYYTGDGNAYDALAEILEKQGDHKQAVEIMTSRLKYDEHNLPALKALASLRAKLGDRAGALDALRLSFYVSPFDYASHKEAGQLSLDEKQYGQALTEFRVALALDPPNVAEANYNLATTYHLLGKQPEAKHAVLRALEAAPSYEKAQELLLRIVGQ